MHVVIDIAMLDLVLVLVRDPGLAPSPLLGAAAGLDEPEDRLDAKRGIAWLGLRCSATRSVTPAAVVTALALALFFVSSSEPRLDPFAAALTWRGPRLAS